MHLAWAEDRALLRKQPERRPRGQDRMGRHDAALFYSGLAPKRQIRHAAASARHSANVLRLLSMCQMIVASLRITATRAMVAPLRRLIRLNHSRNRASFRKTLCVTWARSHRAMELPALVMLPKR